MLYQGSHGSISHISLSKSTLNMSRLLNDRSFRFEKLNLLIRLFLLGTIGFLIECLGSICLDER